jgi:hypothetical protein
MQFTPARGSTEHVEGSARTSAIADRLDQGGVGIVGWIKTSSVIGLVSGWLRTVAVPEIVS